MADEDNAPQGSDAEAAGQADSASSSSDNAFSQEELDALLAQTQAEQPAEENAAAASDAGSNVTDQNELNTLADQLEQTRDSAKTAASSHAAGAEEASEDAASDSDIEAEMAAAIAAEMTADQSAPPAVSPSPAEQPAEPAGRGDEPVVVGSRISSLSPEGAVPADVPDFTPESQPETFTNIGLLDDVELGVKIELGRTEMYIEDVLRLGEGSVIELDKLAGDPVDIFVNERLIARGEVLVLNDNFCVRINHITGPTMEVEDGK